MFVLSYKAKTANRGEVSVVTEAKLGVELMALCHSLYDMYGYVPTSER